MARTPRSELAETIRSARRQRKLTQKQASQEAGVSLRTWERWEAGHSRITLKDIERVADVLGLVLPFLMGVLLRTHKKAP